MREVQITTWCDNTSQHVDERLEGKPIRVTLGASAPREIDLCEHCIKELVEPLRWLLDQSGQVAQSGNDAGALSCLTCGKTYSQPTSLRKHMEREHQQTLDDTTGMPVLFDAGPAAPKTQQAMVCPICQHQSPNRSALNSHTKNMHDKSLAELEGQELPFVCPECSRSFNRVQGMAAHRRSVHGVAGVEAQAGKTSSKAKK